MIFVTLVAMLLITLGIMLFVTHSVTLILYVVLILVARMLIFRFFSFCSVLKSKALGRFFFPVDMSAGFTRIASQLLLLS